MDKKCNKLESLFVFSDEESLKKHLSECEECKAEYEKIQKVSDLIDEVKPYFLKQRNGLRRLRAVAAVFLVIFFGASFGIFYSNEDLADSLMYGETLTAEDLGFPVDSYGLLMVD